MLQAQVAHRSLLLFRSTANCHSLQACPTTNTAFCRRSFWSKSAEKEEGQESGGKESVEEIDDAEEENSSFISTNIAKNMHRRYIPRDKLKFNLNTPEGKVALVYHNTESPASDKRFQYFAAFSVPALFAGSQFVPAPFLTYFYPAMLIPNVYFYFVNYLRSRRLLNTEVEKAWLF